MSTCSGRGRDGAGGGQRRIRPGAVGRRDRLPARRLRAAAAQPERRRADDVRAGQQRTLPAQDLQRRFTIDGVDEPLSMFGMIRHTEKTSPQHTVVAYDDNAAVMEGGPIAALAAAGLHQRAAVRRARRDRARADEGRDAQPPDRDLALRRRGHRRRRRDPRRRRHRPRRRPKAGLTGFSRQQPAPARHRRALGARPRRQARAHRQRAGRS